MNQIKNIKITKELVEKKNIINNDNLYNNKNHMDYIIKTYMNISFEEQKCTEQNIKKKLSSYRAQDIKKNRWNIDKFITFNECIEKLLVCKLNCYYCKNKLLLFYKNIKEPMQWTLDRFDNNLGHYNDNVCISCLKCNLQRRVKNSDHFKFTKQLIIQKSE